MELGGFTLTNPQAPFKIMRWFPFVACTLALSGFFSPSSAVAGPQVKFVTNLGEFVLELDEVKAPITVANFLAYVDEGFYDGTVFHRVMPDFMIQGGGFALKPDGSIVQKPTKEMIKNESTNGLSNQRGTVAMARLNDPDSASAQFFINHGDNPNLNYPNARGSGYAVFGKVVSGMEVVDKIAAVTTGEKMLSVGPDGVHGPQPMDDVPQENVVITSAKRVQQ